MITFLIYGLMGLSMEALWTGVGSLVKRDFRLTSKTSIWMFFIYGSAALFTPVIMAIRPLPLPVRGMIYAVCIFAIEYLSGMLLKSFKLCPWDYSDSPYNVSGVIRLDYTPVWFGVGLIFEFMYVYFLSALLF